MFENQNREHQLTDHARLTRRALLGGLGTVGFSAALFWRLRQLQVIDAEKYLLLADENRINVELIPPARGIIVDRNGLVLAENIENYRISMIREQAGDVKAVLEKLRRIFPMSDEQVARAIKEMESRAAFVKVTVAEHLNWEQIAQVAANAPALPGVKPELGLSRIYQQEQLFAHIVGYVGPVSERDLAGLEEIDPLLQIPKFQIGKIGVEAKAETSLRGVAGAREIEVNHVGREIRELSRTEGESGDDLQLSVDTELQRFTLERLQGQSASVVVMDVENGDILVSASSPSYDPNSFVFGISSREYSELLNHEYRPLHNKAVQGVYPPGSTFKMVVALAGLDAGVISTGEAVHCRGYTELGRQRFHCWRRGGHGAVSMRNSLKHSCDVYYYELAKRCTIDNISSMALKLGLGVRHDLPMSGVHTGLVPNREWKQSRYDESWKVGDTFNAGIGQGYMLTSPLQLAVMTSRIASGKAVVPRLIRAIESQNISAPKFETLDIHPEHLKIVRGGMFAVVNERRGTAYKARLTDTGVAMAGKTGTSQVRRITAAERRAGVTRNEDLPWERRDHALFVAYAPYDAPRYAISVVVEHGGSGSKAAAPIARDVMEEVVRRNPAGNALEAEFDGSAPKAPA